MTDLGRLLDFAERSRLPGGGFGYLGSDGRVDADRPVETWIVARMTHVFGLAHLTGRPGAADLVRHGVAALTGGPLHDAEHGGWRAGADDDAKSAYVHAFVLLAGATATAAVVDGGRALFDEALDVWQTRFWDDAAGLAVEEWNRAWTHLDGYRGANANMHGVEATLAAADAVDDSGLADRLRHQALRTTERVVHGWARERDWRLPEHFTSDWTPLPEHNRDDPAHPFRPYGVTVGHQFEWARLALHLRAAPPEKGVHGDGRPEWLLDDAVALFEAAATRGWAADGHDGFPYTLGWDDRPVVVARMHWVLCEAVAAATVLAAETGESRYLDLARRWRGHGERHFLDPATGSWHHELTPAGLPATGTWTGQPDAYHLVQMLLLEGRPVRGSIAAALR